MQNKNPAQLTRVIGIVGPCSSGKSTLIAGLKGLGIYARHIAQEHSYAPNMWQHMVNPDTLIYLDVSYQVSMQRRPLDMSQSEFNEQVTRLENARQHANLYLQTDNLTPQDVLAKVVSYLKEKNY